MSATPAAPRRRYPLHVHLAALFTALVLLCGGLLAWLAYVQGRDLALAAADDVFAHVERETPTALRAALAPVGDLAELLAEHPLARARTLDERLAALPMLGLVLRAQAPVAAAYVGYDDGAFFLARRLVGAQQRALFGAPDDAAMLVQSVEVRGTPVATWIFLDASLHEIGRRPGDPSYDPRTRPWFRLAIERGRRVLTDPYVFFATRTPGMTVALRTPAASVVGIDVALAGVAERLAALRTLPGMEIALFDEGRRVLATSDAARPVVAGAGDTLSLVTLDELGVPALARLAGTTAATRPHIPASTFVAGNREWKGSVVSVMTARGPLSLAVAVPLDELLAGARKIRDRSLLATLAVLLVAIPATWGMARVAARSLGALTRQAQDIRAFRFEGADARPSPILEIDELAEAMGRMRVTIRRFLEIASSLGAEKNFERLRARTVRETAAAAGAEAGIAYLLSDDGRELAPGPLVRAESESPLRDPAPLSVEGDSPIARALRDAGPTVCELDVAAVPGGLVEEWTQAGATLVAIPLRNRAGEPLGVLALLARAGAAPSASRLAFAHALSGTAAVAIETQRLLEARKALLDAFIRLIAGAIDAKSPYTGGHCQRVPELTLMLADAACETASGPLAGFRLDDDQWEALRLASWLHDCGKVTTPEYVVDKATKLETLYDRIHEVRMRFEVLKRDAEIRYWRARTQGANDDAMRAALDAELAALDDDYRFVAGCNEGGEFIDPAKFERLRRIAARTWLRTLDDRIGLSTEERARRARVPAPPLPVVEPLLADKPEHVIERTADERLPEGFGFAMQVPALKYNRGELHNLSVGRGTLTEEERYVINHHIVQTIVMLSQLPFPRHLRDVPDIAGGHHEKMDGTGYPRRLKRGEMSWTARMMAIADIFEALTAVDRPYKRGKSLSEALRIMAYMRRDGHVDPDLFELFLRSGVYRRYAEMHLRPEQIDEVEIGQYLAAA